jgi:hypothetical protein
VIEQLFDYLSPAESRTTGSGASSSSHRPLVRASDFADMVRPVEQVILKYPAGAMATAFLVGVALAWWIKRK